MSDKHHKGQVFFKFLWQSEAYKTGENGVSPTLANDVKAIAVQHDWIEHDQKVTNAKVFRWITGSVIPRWARLSGFILAVRHGWNPVDYEDVMSVICLEPNDIAAHGARTILERYHLSHGLTFPKPVVQKVISDLEDDKASK